MHVQFFIWSYPHYKQKFLIVFIRKLTPICPLNKSCISCCFNQFVRYIMSKTLNLRGFPGEQVIKKLLLFFIYNKTTATHRATYRMGEKRYTKIIWRCCAKYWTGWNSEKSSGRSGVRTQDRPVTHQFCGKPHPWLRTPSALSRLHWKNRFSLYRQSLQICLFSKKSGRSGARTQDRPVMSRLL